MTKLLNEELVVETGNPKRYALTEEGTKLAKKLSSVHEKSQVVHSSGSDSDLASIISSLPTLPPNSITSTFGLNTRSSESLKENDISLANSRLENLSLNSLSSRSPRTVPLQDRTTHLQLSTAKAEPEKFANKFHQQRLQKENDAIKKVLESFSGRTRIMKSGNLIIIKGLLKYYSFWIIEKSGRAKIETTFNSNWKNEELKF
jgi:hypothetical protein